MANTEFTSISEMAQHAIRCRDDPVYFINSITGSSSHAELINELKNSNNTIIKNNNFSGTADYLAWYSFFHSNSSIIIAAWPIIDSLAIMKMVNQIHEAAPKWLVPQANTKLKTRLVLDNGSQIIAKGITSDVCRGHTPNKVYFYNLEGALAKNPDRIEEIMYFTPFIFRNEFEQLKPITS